jgi:hypothetical protein
MRKIETAQFPMQCPLCRVECAFPYCASTELDKHDAIQLSMRCRNCKHEWNIEQCHPSPFPAIERRHANG